MVLHIDHVSKSFRRHLVLKDIDFKLKQGEFLTILGSNGAGKTTLLKIIATILKPSNGNIFFKGENITNHPAVYRRQLGVISHHSFLYGDLSGRQNLKFYSKLYDITEENRIEMLLKQVALENKANQLVRSYSRGMLQRLSIARALLHDPEILLFDEPFTGLDQVAETVLDQILNQNHTGHRLAILVTHDLRKGYEHADQLTVLKDGRLINLGQKSDLSFDNVRKTYEKHIH